VRLRKFRLIKVFLVKVNSNTITYFIIMRSLMKLFMLGLLVCSFSTVRANGISVSSVSLQGQNTTSGTWQIQYNVTWNNSWRDAVNWDAAWIFAKFKVGAGPWTHCRLDTFAGSVNTGTGTGAVVIISPDSVGSIIHRNAAGSGTFTQSGVEIRWHYSPQGVLNTDVPEVRVFAIEMVYIAAGNFTIGDGNGSSEAVNALRGTFGVANSYTVNTNLSPPISAAGAFANGNNILRIDGDGGVDNNGDGIIDNANYPVGFNSFYLMKYEISQEQYADFLNVLTPTQQTTRWIANFNVSGQRINSFSGGTVYLTDRPDRAQNFLNWPDAAAYSDWAGLRPITETEFEKAGRGPLAPVVNEYAWGTINANPGNTNITLSGAETGSETASSVANNSWFFGYTVTGGDAGSSRPVRVGLCTGAGQNRTDGGTSWWGVVDMSSNLGEMVVNISTVAGRSFTGQHGNGFLSNNGNGNVHNWPGMNGNNNNAVVNGITGEITSSAGIGTKCNFLCASSGESYRLSYRSCVENHTTLNTRTSNMGYRAGRSEW